MNRTLLALACAAAVTGCVEIRASSRQQMKDDDAQVQVSADAQQAMQVIAQAFAHRGYQIIDRHPNANGGFDLTFKGDRSTVTVVTGNQYAVSTSSNKVGSVFYARFTPEGGATKVFFLGKPTFDGMPVCSDDDALFGAPCEQRTVGALWPGLQQTSGREEAETIRSIVIELQMGAPPAPLPPAPPAPTT